LVATSRRQRPASHGLAGQRRLRLPRLGFDKRPHARSRAGGPKIIDDSQRELALTRAPGRRPRLRSGRLPVGGRTDPCADALVPAATHPVRDPRRHPRSLPRPRLLNHLVPPPERLIQLGFL